MDLKNLLKSMPLPAIYKRDGKECYFDTYRKKLIEITPEETVRQKIAKLFEIKYGVPEEIISLEVPMSYYAAGVSGRADIVIHAYDTKTQCCYPVTVIECKNETVLLTDKVMNQVTRYCDIVGGKYVVLTNGIDIRMAVYDEKNDAYAFLEELLPYNKMLNEEYVIPEFKAEEYIRFAMSELRNQDKLKEYNEMGSWIFGADSNSEIRTFAVNFYQSLLDVEHKLPSKKLKAFEMLEDLGLRYMDYTNAGGGHYNGDYSTFLVNDRFGETQLISVSIFGTDSDFRGEKRGSYTSRVVSIDKFKTSHNSLQYNVDRFANVRNDGKICFAHNGQIGGFKSQSVIDKVSQYGCGLQIVNTKIKIGELDCNSLLYLDAPDVANYMYNLIEYALLREEVRTDSRN